MKFFELIDKDVAVTPFLEEVAANSALWSADTSRQELHTMQRETHTVSLRASADRAAIDTLVRRAKPIAYEGRPSAVSSLYPVASNYVDELARRMDGTLGRVVMTTLKPGGKIYPHTDDGLYWLLRDRYHLVLKSSSKGSYFRAHDEEIRMHAGELWWFDPTVEHEVFNDSEEDRIHVIVDVLSRQSMGTFRKRVLRSPLRSLRACIHAGASHLAFPIRERFSRVAVKI